MKVVLVISRGGPYQCREAEKAVVQAVGDTINLEDDGVEPWFYGPAVQSVAYGADGTPYIYVGDWPPDDRDLTQLGFRPCGREVRAVFGSLPR